MVKEIGSASRKNLESQLGRRIPFSLWVKVKQAWRDESGAVASHRPLEPPAVTEATHRLGRMSPVS